MTSITGAFLHPEHDACAIFYLNRKEVFQDRMIYPQGYFWLQKLLQH
jgi:hypothetical protein